MATGERRYHPAAMGTPLFAAGLPDVVYLVDLSSYLLRAYHAIAPLSSPRGEPTHAIHGTVTMLERLYRERRPAQLAIAMDSGRKTFRKDLYPEYKANRPPAPADLKSQIERSEEIIRAEGIPIFKQDGVEADDLIASATVALRRAGNKVVIVSADKDLMQLIDEGTVLWDTLRNKVFGIPEVEARFGVSPQKLGDLLALMGDSSDNIPGVPSVGPKTAATLLEQYGSLAGIFEHTAEITRKKLRQTLEENREAALLSRQLVELKSDIPLDLTPENLQFGRSERRDLDVLENLFSELGFTRQLAQLREGKIGIQLAEQRSSSGPAEAREATPPESTTESAKPTGDSDQRTPQTTERGGASQTSVQLVCTEDELTALEKRLAQGTWAMEVHTLSPSLHYGPLVAISVTSETEAYYLPFAHRTVGAPRGSSAEVALPRLLTALDQGNADLVVHHLKRLVVLCSQGGDVCAPGRAFDTLLASYLLDPEQKHDIPTLGQRSGVHVRDFDEIAKEGRKRLALDEIAVDLAAPYFAESGRALLAAASAQRERLEESGLADLLGSIEEPLSRLLASMEVRGVLIDTAELARLGGECELTLAALEQEATQAAGKEFNLNSPRQLETILFDDLGLKPIKRTKTSRSTDAQTLEALAEQHCLPEIILRHRQIAKLKGTYIDSLPALVNPQTGRVHGSWEQAVAATGRISSSDPNLQNIPIRSELGRAIRAAFIAPPDHVLVSADYSQIELRVLAHLSKDARLLEAFQTGQDVHTRTAMELFGVSAEGVTREMRTKAKAVNFGVIYGQGESGLAKALKIPRAEAKTFIEAYFDRYEGVRSFMDGVLERARQGEAVSSLLGRRRIVPDIKSGNRARRLAAERVAMNMPIQGSAADILKLAMLKLRVPPTPGCRMVLTVHDELVFEVPAAELPEAKRLIKTGMETAYELMVPLEVSVGAAANWKEAH